MVHTDTTMADALKDYANTALHTKDIAVKYGVSPSTLTVWAKKAKVPLRGRGRDKQTQPDTRQRKILEMAEVITQAQVGKMFSGITKQRVSKIVKRWSGWKHPRQSPFQAEDVILWKGKFFTVLEGGVHCGRVRDDQGRIIHTFYWHMDGCIAQKVDPNMAKKTNGHRRARAKK